MDNQHNMITRSKKNVISDNQVIYDDLHPPERRMPEHQYPDRYVKRLINTSIIQAGKNELETSGVDTNFRYNTGNLKYYGDNSGDNTGIKIEPFLFRIFFNHDSISRRFMILLCCFLIHENSTTLIYRLDYATYERNNTE